MLIKTYNRFIYRTFNIILLKVILIFATLIFTLNLFEEISFFKDDEKNFYFPLLLTFLNLPSLLYDTFPFIFLISTQFFFIKIIQNDELNIFKIYGVKNIELLLTLVVNIFIIGVFIVTIFYNLSAKFKNIYIDFKNSSSNDNKYLAVITENGLWIKDELKDLIYIINANKIEEKLLHDVSIFKFDKKFNLQETIFSDKVSIETKKWILTNPKISSNNRTTKETGDVIFNSHFDYNKIMKLYSNLSSLTFFELLQLKKDYRSIGYSTSDIELHMNKIYSFPFSIMIVSLFAGILMLNIGYNKDYIFNVILGIMLSVTIYYINYLSFTLGENDKLPITLSVWLPIIILSMFNLIGLVRINEK